MNNEVDKRNVMNNLNNRKDVELFRGVSVTEDYTASERMPKQKIVKKNQIHVINGKLEEPEKTDCV